MSATLTSTSTRILLFFAFPSRLRKEQTRTSFEHLMLVRNRSLRRQGMLPPQSYDHGRIILDSVYINPTRRIHPIILPINKRHMRHFQKRNPMKSRNPRKRRRLDHLIQTILSTRRKRCVGVQVPPPIIPARRERRWRAVSPECISRGFQKIPQEGRVGDAAIEQRGNDAGVRALVPNDAF